MKRRQQTSWSRGHAMLLVLLGLASAAALAMAVAGSLELHHRGARAQERRTQALWLARSAAAQAAPLRRSVPVGAEAAAVEVKVARAPGGTSVEASADLPRHGRATVRAVLAPDGTATAWDEEWLPR